MRKFAIAMALASTAIASPALARNDAWYVGVDGGVMLVEDIDLDVTTAGVTTDNFATIDHKKGFDFGGVIGYDFGAFRMEAEASYREAGHDYITAGAPGVGTNLTGLPRAVSTDAGGETTALSFMVNGLLDFGDDDGLQGSVGAGAGISRVMLHDVVATSWLHDSDTGFAWQALAEVRAPLSDNWDVGLKYRFFNAPNVDLVDAYGRDIETKMRSHSLMGSLRYNFGGAPVVVPPPAPLPEPTPVPPPPAPEPAPVVTCQPGPYIVFFDWDQDNITSDAAGILDNAISAYNAGCTGTSVMLAGNADRSGSATYNVGLSQRRANNVASYMTGRGIPGSVITTQAFGESRPRVDTPDGVRNDQNRNVQITYGPNSGM